MTKYQCPECDKIVNRESMALRIESYCSQAGVMVLLVRCIGGERVE